MNLKKLFIRLFIIVVITAMLVPSFITRLDNENKNKDVVLALNYNNFANSLSEKKFDELLKTSKEDGINTLYIGEESINSLAQRGKITALLYSELKRMIDDESREIVKILDENTKELKKARNVLKEEGFGIDTFEDDFLTPDN